MGIGINDGNGNNDENMIRCPSCSCDNHKDGQCCEICGHRLYEAQFEYSWVKLCQ